MLKFVEPEPPPPTNEKVFEEKVQTKDTVSLAARETIAVIVPPINTPPATEADVAHVPRAADGVVTPFLTKASVELYAVLELL